MHEDHLNTMLLYAAGELSPEETAEFKTHLSSCRECQLGLETAQKAHEWEKIAEKEPSPDLFAATLSRSEKHLSRPFSNKRPVWWGVLTAATTGLAVVAVFMLRQARPEPSWDTDLPARLMELENNVHALDSEIRMIETNYPEVSDTVIRGGTI